MLTKKLITAETASSVHVLVVWHFQRPSKRSWTPGSQGLWLAQALAAAFTCLFTVITDAWHQLMFATITFFLLETIRCFLAPFRLHRGNFPPSLEMGRILVIRVLALIWEVNFKEK